MIFKAILRSQAAATAGNPPPIDAHGWFEEHVRLSYDFFGAIARAGNGSSEEARAAATRSHEALLRHAQLVLGDQVPVILSKNGGHTIEYKALADARAKVRELRAEVASLRAQIASRGST